MAEAKRPVIPETEAGSSMVSPFSKDEYRKGVATLKNNKAADRDDVLVEQLKNLGPNAHILNTKMKVATRNNLLKKLANSKWGTNARTIRTTALALCYSTAEYAAPVWARSSHANKLNQF